MTKFNHFSPCRWFFGNCTRSDAVNRLMAPGLTKGSYLVRESETRPGKFSPGSGLPNLVKLYPPPLELAPPPPPSAVTRVLSWF